MRHFGQCLLIFAAKHRIGLWVKCSEQCPYLLKMEWKVNGWNGFEMEWNKALKGMEWTRNGMEWTNGMEGMDHGME